jgi:hypothetical protein
VPTADEHQRQADHNERFLQSIDEDEFCDWLATAAFYVAVHLIEKVRALSNEHNERLDFVRNQHPQIHLHYRELYSFSLQTRYGIAPHHWLLPEHVTGHLAEIKRYVELLAPSSPSSP